MVGRVPTHVCPANLNFSEILRSTVTGRRNSHFAGTVAVLFDCRFLKIKKNIRSYNN